MQIFTSLNNMPELLGPMVVAQFKLCALLFDKKSHYIFDTFFNSMVSYTSEVVVNHKTSKTEVFYSRNKNWNKVQVVSHITV